MMIIAFCFSLVEFVECSSIEVECKLYDKMLRDGNVSFVSYLYLKPKKKNLYKVFNSEKNMKCI